MAEVTLKSNVPTNVPGRAFSILVPAPGEFLPFRVRKVPWSLSDTDHSFAAVPGVILTNLV